MLFVPDGSAESAALSRTTHLGIGAHADDLEIMALHGIGACFSHENRWFTGVIITDGRSSPRTGPFAKLSDEEMATLRWQEQKNAAELGAYSAVIGLERRSAEIKGKLDAALVEQIASLLTRAQPEIVYTHNLFDIHETHIAVARHVIAALRTVPKAARPHTVYGCEVWRSLDWLPKRYRSELDVTGHEALGQALVAMFDSQILGGKRYDAATLGRKRANATFGEPRQAGTVRALDLALDLTPFLRDDSLQLDVFAREILGAYEKEILLGLTWK